MEHIFLKILNMSITATYLALAVILLRLLLRRVPRAIHVVMWAMVGVRLLCPVSIKSILSLIPSAETLPGDILYTETPVIQSGIPALNAVVNPLLSQSFAPTVGESVNPMQVLTFAGSLVWLIGVAVMLIYMALSYLRVYRMTAEAMPLGENVWIGDGIQTPFILGMVCPRIYLPSGMPEEDQTYVIAHEQAHLSRRDHWWKPLGFLLLTVHWFSPVLWVAYVLLCRDIELACDEKVIRGMGTESKKPYSDALINCSAPRMVIAACPLAFGEVGVRQRIRNVLRYKKPAFWLVLAAILLCVMLAAGFMTDPMRKNPDGSFELEIVLEKELQELILGVILENAVSRDTTDFACCADFVAFGREEVDGNITLYLHAMYVEYMQAEKGVYEKVIPERYQVTVITVKQLEDGYELMEYWRPRTGDLAERDIREKVPEYLQEYAFRGDELYARLEKSCKAQAKAYFEGPTNGPESYLQQLRAQYPQYFDLPTDKGLVVYVWQFGPSLYYCGLVDGRNIGHTDEEILRLQGIGIPEMRAIVESYGIAKERVSVWQVRHPLSSYWGTIDREKAEEVFWQTGEIGETPEFSTIMAAKTFDVDGDGRKENCVLSFGPTSGLFTVVFAATEQGGTKQEYYNTFQLPYGGAPVEFAECEDGVVRLIFYRESASGEVRYDISVKDGNIVLSLNGESMPYYGKQGVQKQ